MLRRVVVILSLITAFVLAPPACVYAETLPCIVDESGCYVSGAKMGQQDEDLMDAKGGCIAVSQKENGDAKLLPLLLSMLSLLTSQYFVMAVIGVCVVLAVVGIIQLGGHVNHNVRRKEV